MKKVLLFRNYCLKSILLLGLLFLFSNNSWGQQVIGQFPTMDGGFEGQASSGAITSATSYATGVQSSVWTTSSSSMGTFQTTSPRSGGKYININFTSTTKRLQSPTASQDAIVGGTVYTVQYFYKTASTTAPGGTVQKVGASCDGTSPTTTMAYTSITPLLTATSGSWSKVQFSVTATPSTGTTKYGYVCPFRTDVAMSAAMDIDDFVMYAGAVDNTAPDAPTTPSISNITSTSQTVSWLAPTSGVDGGGYMVVRNTADPSTAPNGNGIYAVGNNITGTEKVVYIGTSSTFTDTLPTAGNYYYRIYTVDKAFNYSSPLTVNNTNTAPSYAAEPATQASNISFSNISQTGFTINWTAGNGTNSLVVVKSGSAVNADPSDGNTYSSNPGFGSGTLLGTGNYVVYNGTGNSVSITGLSKAITYYVKVYTFNGSGGSENYLITNPPSGNQLTLPDEITSVTSGLWSATTTWSGGVIPTQYDNVTIGTGHTVDFNTTDGKCYNLTIPSGTKVWANTGAKTLQIYGTSLVCNGTLGDPNNSLPTGSQLTLEFGGNLTISGSGSIYPFKLRPITGIQNIGVTFDANVSLTATGTTLMFDNVGNDNIYYTVNSSRTLNIATNFNTCSSSATQSTSNNTLTINSGATVNVGGVLNTNEATGKTYTANINGTLAVTGTSTLSGNTGGGTATFNVNGTYTAGNINVTPITATIAPVINVGSSGSITVSGTADFSNPSLVGYIGNAPSTTGGSFNLNSTGSMLLSSANGLEPISGPIRTSNRNFANGSSYSFVGNVAQVNGADLPNSISNLTINNAAGVTIQKATDITGKLTLTAGLFNTGNYLTLKSTATATASVAPVLGTISGNATVERYIPAKRAWRALTSPVNTTNSISANWQENGTGNTINGFDIWSNSGGTGIISGGSGSSLLSYNSSTNNWSGITDTTTSSSLLSGSVNKPFMAFVTGPYGSGNVTSGATATTIRATGALFTGNQTYANSANQYTFIGNPYASPLDPALMLNDTDNAAFGGNIWVWDANATGSNTVGTYNLFNNGTYTNVTSNPVVTSGTQIQSGQAFFVKSAAGGTFTIKEAHKGTTFSNAVFRTAAPELLRVGLYKQVNNEWSGRDGAMTVILSDADANQSPNKMANSTENIAFTKNGANFASNHHLPLVASDVLNVKVWNTTAGDNYKLKINTEEFSATNLEATLEDLFTNSRTPLTLDGSAVEYPFTVTTDALSTGDRFRIVFQSSLLGTTLPTASGFSIVPNPVTGDSFQVNLGKLATGAYSYSICNAIGQEVAKGTINNATQNTNYEVKMSNAATGIYIMKIKGSDNSVFTAKIIKK